MIESTRMEQGARLEQLLKALKTTQTAFAESVDVSQSNINKIIRGAKGLSRTVINGLAVMHKNVNVHWLLTGEGEMFLSNPAAATSRMEEPAAEYGKGGLLFGQVEQLLAEHSREIRELRERVARLEGESKKVN